MSDLRSKYNLTHFFSQKHNVTYFFFQKRSISGPKFKEIESFEIFPINTLNKDQSFCEKKDSLFDYRN